MSIKEAAREFIAAHKPSRIDVDHIKTGFGSVEGYLDAEGQTTGDCGGRYVEIDGFDAKHGNPIIIDWYEESWQIAYYSKAESERTTRADCEPTIIFDPDFDCAIDLALEKLDESDVYDLSVTRFDDGAPQDIINIDDYVTAKDEVSA
jgi:hypothetical protein